MDYTLSEVRDDYIRAFMDTQSLLKDLEDAFVGHILVFSAADAGHELIYVPEELGPFATLAETGIDPDTPSGSIATLHLNGQRMIYTLSDTVTTDDVSGSQALRAAFMLPYDSLTFRRLPRGSPDGAISTVDGAFHLHLNTEPP